VDLTFKFNKSSTDL